MSAHRAASYLIEFGSVQASSERPVAPTPARANKADDRVQVELKQSFDRGYAEGRRVAVEEFDAASKEKDRLLAERQADDRRQWAAQESAGLCQSLTRGLEEIEWRLSEIMALVILPFVEDQIREQAIRELREMVKSWLRDGAVTAIRGRAPKDIIERLRSNEDCPELASASLVPGGSEILLHLDASVVETRMEKWISELRRAVK